MHNTNVLVVVFVKKKKTDDEEHHRPNIKKEDSRLQGQIHPPLSDGPSAKCGFKNSLFFIRIQWNLGKFK